MKGVRFALVDPQGVDPQGAGLEVVQKAEVRGDRAG